MTPQTEEPSSRNIDKSLKGKDPSPATEDTTPQITDMGPRIDFLPQIFSDEDFIRGSLFLQVTDNDVVYQLDAIGGYYFNQEMKSPLWGGNASINFQHHTVSAYYMWDKSFVTGCLLKKGVGTRYRFNNFNFLADLGAFYGEIYYTDREKQNSWVFDGKAGYTIFNNWTAMVTSSILYMYLFSSSFSNMGVSTLFNVFTKLKFDVWNRNLIFELNGNGGKVWKSDFDFFRFKVSDSIRSDGSNDRKYNSVMYSSFDTFFFPFPISSLFGQLYLTGFTDFLLGINDTDLLSEAGLHYAGGGGLGYVLGASRFSALVSYSDLNRWTFIFQVKMEI